MRDIIVLGFDNSGKTTLTGQLQQLYDYTVQGSTGPVSKQVQLDFINQAITNQDPIIYERFPYFEELVYGPALRGKSNFEKYDLLWVYLKQWNPIIIYCRPEPEVIFDFGDREQMGGVIERSSELLMRWDTLIFELIREGWTVIPYNYKVDRSLERLYYKINKEQENDYGPIKGNI